MTHISQDNSRRLLNLHCGKAQNVPEKKGFVIAVGLDLKSNMDSQYLRKCLQSFNYIKKPK